VAQGAKDILTALKTRLQTTGYPVHLGGQVTDDQSDSLPAIVVYYDPDTSEKRDGDGREARVGHMTKSKLQLVVQVVGDAGDTDPLLVQEDWDEALNTALWPHQDKDDDLTSAASDLYFRKRTVGEPEGSSLKVNNLHITITYLRDLS
jgi:hypothetical protein